MVQGLSCGSEWHKRKLLWRRPAVLEEKERNHRGNISVKNFCAEMRVIMLMNLIKTRHSIRKYTDSQIKRKDLE